MATTIATGTLGRAHTVPDVASSTFLVASGTQTFTGVPSFVGATGGAATDGLLLGGGTSATKATTATADKNFMEFYTSSTATSGDSRALYIRHFFSGTGVSGEAIRAVGIVNNKTVATGGTVNGAHISLELDGANAVISGQANAIRATFMASATPTVFGGTCAVIDVETNLPSSATIPATMAFMRFINLDATKPNLLFSIEAASSTMCANAGTTTGSPGATGGSACQKVLKCAVDGVAYYLALYNTNS